MANQTPKIIYRGVSMIPEWPDRIRDAQKTDAYLIDGAEYPRVRYGEEREDWGANARPCHDCAVIKGEFHVEGCDVERCPACSGQLISCDCGPDEDDLEQG